MTDVVDGSLGLPQSPIASRASGRDRVGRSSLWTSPVTNPWKWQYGRRLLWTDAAVVLTAVGATHLTVTGIKPPQTMNLLMSAALVLAWMAALSFFRTRDERVIGVGFSEWQRVVRATGLLLAWLAVGSLVTQSNLSRPYLGMSLSLGTAGLLAGRVAWRRWLVRERSHGREQSKVLVVGGPRASRTLTERLGRIRSGSLSVAGVWVPDEESRDSRIEVEGQSLLVMGSDFTLTEAVRLSGADTVVVTDTEHLGPEGMRDLSWDLDALGVDLMLLPNVLDVARPRLQIQDVGDLVLLHLAEPRYEGATRLTKTVFDRMFALMAITALTPVLLATALAVKLTSAGPVLFKQVRIGKDGNPIRVWKFRTMVVGADDQLAALLQAQGSADKPLFKVDDDPRVTKVGNLLRRLSLDELPQFFNVLRGEMSVVGPRPQVPAEVALYGDRDHYRLRVRPGITGLWQVSGRSDLSWEDAIRLDIDYVENWSMMRDIQIIYRTVGAVVTSAGAR